MIRVIDSIMGSGKTSYAIQMINAHPENRYVYITPYLDEVERIKMNCPNFSEPEYNRFTGELKLDSLNTLLDEGKNIASTHALFKLTNRKTIEALRKWNYVLIIDEVMEVVSSDDFKPDDLSTILEAKLAHIDETTGYLVWDKANYDGVFNRIKKLCLTQSVFVVNNVALVWVFPATIFGYFDETYILTYMFDSQIQRYYFDMNMMEYKYYSVRDIGGRNYELVDYVQNDDRSKIQINIHTGKKNDIGTVPQGKDKSAFNYLSSSAFDRMTHDTLLQLKRHMVTFFKYDCKSQSEVNLWTAFKKNQRVLEAYPYKNEFLACNARAINAYRHKTSIAYVINVFINPYVLKFFKLHSIEISKEQQRRYALSMLLQFLFRSAIRDGKPINLYIPSVRMRHALQEWLGLPKAD